MSTGYYHENSDNINLKVQFPLNEIYCGNCLDILPLLDTSSVDMILCDIPYGTTACPWDVVLPLPAMWYEFTRVIKPARTIALFGSEPFSSHLRTSNITQFKYDWVWEKGRASGYMHAKNKPLKVHEIISIFSSGTTVHATQSANRMQYFPQFTAGKPYRRVHKKINSGKLNHMPSASNDNFVGTVLENTGRRYPRSVLHFSQHNVGTIHPTQKPVDLCEYLIRTYTSENEIVLDACAGSGTTGIACMRSNRQFILIEIDEEYCLAARQRLDAEAVTLGSETSVPEIQA